MSHEKQTSPHEQPKHHENKEAKKQISKLESARNSEAAGLSSQEGSDLKEAQSAVKQEAISGAEYAQPKSEKQARATKSVTILDKKHAFNSLMHSVRQDLSAPEKTFSKFVHHPKIEKTSELLGKTVVRPSGVIGAASFALTGIFLAYLFARRAGFSLTGTELPVLLILGFACGLLVEWLYKSLRTIKNNAAR